VKDGTDNLWVGEEGGEEVGVVDEEGGEDDPTECLDFIGDFFGVCFLGLLLCCGGGGGGGGVGRRGGGGGIGWLGG